MIIDYPQRISKLNRLLATRQLDALVLFGPENLRYFCGFTGSSGVLIVDRQASRFLTDSRYATQALQQVAAGHVGEYKQQVEAVSKALVDSGAEKIGFEASLAYGQVETLREKSPAAWQWVALQQELQELRLHKSRAEIAAIETATRFNAEAFNAILPLIRPGVSERELALELEFALKRLGAEEKAFDFIVASGERGALPHGVASDRLLQLDELVTFDFGCRVDGYHSDETVTLALGRPADRLREVYDLVLAAHDRALAAVAPGMPLAELDRLARELIEDAGFGEYFGHGLGHGVGLQVHEAPVVSPRSSAVAEEGMVFTIEPGVYLPDIGGVRIEDMVLVTARGHHVLTSLPKEFRAVSSC